MSDMTEDVSSERDERVLRKLGYTTEHRELTLSGGEPYSGPVWFAPVRLYLGLHAPEVDTPQVIVQMIEWLLEQKEQLDIYGPAGHSTDYTVVAGRLRGGPTLADALTCAVDAVEEKPE